mmetsp:Transcript_31240/g.71923  ORF Transcript_31240/g.71923 Transcript_31240/m.71923 type:complete len:98 (+) Transcript_31240:756-1049(+)
MTTTPKNLYSSHSSPEERSLRWADPIVQNLLPHRNGKDLELREYPRHFSLAGATAQKRMYKIRDRPKTTRLQAQGGSSDATVKRKSSEWAPPNYLSP